MKTKILTNALFSLGIIFALVAALPFRVTAGSSHPRYKLIDLGTLGGPDGSQVFPAKSVNNRGEVIAFSATAVPDPYSPNCLQGDCFVNHGIERENNGVITDLPFPAGIDGTMNNSLAGWITESGLIAGFAENGLIDPLTGFPQVRAVLWDKNGSAINLGTLGGNSSQTNATNNRGQVVGMALNATAENPAFAQVMNFLPAATQTRAFLWQGGSIKDLGTLGGNDACAVDINEAGQVFGFSYTNSSPNDSTGIPTIHPFLWQNGQMLDLGSLGGTIAQPGSFAFGPFGVTLNSRGQAVGTSTLAGDNTQHAFLWTGRKMQDLGTLGGNNSEALAINDGGQVVGRADITPTNSFHHAFLWKNGVMTDLGTVNGSTCSTANSINARGQVVGSSGICGVGGFGFLSENGQPVVDLSTLVLPGSNITVTDAAYINDRGEIAGDGMLPGGEIHPILLVPIP